MCVSLSKKVSQPNPSALSSLCRESEKKEILHQMSKFAISYKMCPLSEKKTTMVLSGGSTLQTLLLFQPFVSVGMGRSFKSV